MTKAEIVIRKALFDTYSVEEVKKAPKSIQLKNIDEEYDGFVIEQEYYDYGEIFYFAAALFIIETNGQLVPLAGITNIGYRPEEAIEELAKVMERFKKEAG